MCLNEDYNKNVNVKNIATVQHSSQTRIVLKHHDPVKVKVKVTRWSMLMVIYKGLYLG